MRAGARETRSFERFNDAAGNCRHAAALASGPELAPYDGRYDATMEEMAVF